MVTAMPASKPDPARRNERSRRALLAAAIALISDLGYDRVSIEAIAKRAGVDEHTIYRWWPSKGAVALEALHDSLATVVDFRASSPTAGITRRRSRSRETSRGPGGRPDRRRQTRASASANTM